VGAPAQRLLPFWRMITVPATGASAVLHAGENDPFAVGGGCRADEPKWHAVRLEKRSRLCSARRSAASTFCVFSMAPKNRIFLPDCC
jgi:hypothetical protein